MSAVFDKSLALLQVQTMMGQLVVLQEIIENTDDAAPSADPAEVCPRSESGKHDRIAWERDGTGMCRDCGAQIDAPEEPPADDGVGVSPDGGEQPSP